MNVSASFFLAKERQAMSGGKVMDDLDYRILKAMNTYSPASFVSPIKVNEEVKLEKTKFGDRIMHMKKSGYVDVITKEFISSMTLPNFIAKIKITDLGKRALQEAR
jgi:hypothetical protein